MAAWECPSSSGHDTNQASSLCLGRTPQTVPGLLRSSWASAWGLRGGQRAGERPQLWWGWNHLSPISTYSPREGEGENEETDEGGNGIHLTAATSPLLGRSFHIYLEQTTQSLWELRQTLSTIMPAASRGLQAWDDSKISVHCSHHSLGVCWGSMVWCLVG